MKERKTDRNESKKERRKRTGGKKSTYIHIYINIYMYVRPNNYRLTLKRCELILVFCPLALYTVWPFESQAIVFSVVVVVVVVVSSQF
jgi:hypothetical protein